MVGFSRRHLTKGAIAAVASLASCRRSDAERPLDAEAFTPEQFGAKGDGLTDDTSAFAALAEQVNRSGGGTVVLRKTIYRVGTQRRMPAGADSYAYEPAKIMEFSRCGRPLVIQGNGAILACVAGLRFGTFDRRSGAPTRHSLPVFRADEIATPYRWMIKIEHCTGPVEISDLELRGSVGRLLIGGPYGDIGHQIPGTGLGLYDNMGDETIRRVYSHHHPLDGITIDGFDGDRPGRAGLVEDVRCEYNGRQGCSVVGGRNYSFSRCHFNHTGKAGLGSPPGAGVDIEAERGKRIRRLRFSDCEFSDNLGAGVVADQGDSEDVQFQNCTFLGTTNWAAWPKKPYFRFNRSSFIGPIVACLGDEERPERAVHFHECTFRDNPALSPTGEVFGGTNPDRPIADLPFGHNVLFKSCRFDLTHQATLPFSVGVVYHDCLMSQRSTRRAYPRGTYRGNTIIKGNVDLSYARVEGELQVNGERVAPS